MSSHELLSGWSRIVTFVRANGQTDKWAEDKSRISQIRELA
jgi:hypothetical protein